MLGPNGFLLPDFYTMYNTFEKRIKLIIAPGAKVFCRGFEFDDDQQPCPCPEEDEDIVLTEEE